MKKIIFNQIKAKFEGMNYALTTLEEAFTKPHTDVVFRTTPEKNAILLKV